MNVNVENKLQVMNDFPVETPTERIARMNKESSLVFMFYMFLLILAVLTSWIFKKRNIQSFHESTFCILYGLLAGALISYMSTSIPVSHLMVTLPADFDNSSSQIFTLPPQRVYLRIPLNNTDDESRSFVALSHLSRENAYNNHNPSPYIIDNNNSHIFQYDYAMEISDPRQASASLEERAAFKSVIFFNVLLPPIIFAAGYNMKRKHFFHNFGAIITYAFGGTLISSVVTGLTLFGFTRFLPDLKQLLSVTDCLLFGAMISATDPVAVLSIFNHLEVDVTLYALVFGESVLNDVVSIVLFESVAQFGEHSQAEFHWHALLAAGGNFLASFFGAFAVGVLMGMVTALLMKFSRLKDFPLLETATLATMSYAAYLGAEAAGLTSIVAILFCGVTQANYTYHNLSEDSKQFSVDFFDLMNFLAETFVFVYIGVSVFTYREYLWHWGLIGLALVSMLLGRALNVYPLTAFLNLGRQHRITGAMQHMIFFAGMRGAMAFALAIRDTTKVASKLFLSATLVSVLFTVVIFGGLISHLLRWLHIPVGVDSDSVQPDPILRTFSSVLIRRAIQLQPPTGTVVSSPKSCLAQYWAILDTTVLKPMLTHSDTLLEEVFPKFMRPLAQMFTSDEQRTRAIGKVGRGSTQVPVTIDIQQNYTDEQHLWRSIEAQNSSSVGHVEITEKTPLLNAGRRSDNEEEAGRHYASTSGSPRTII